MVLRVAHSAVGGELLVLWDGVIVGHSGSQIAVLDDVIGEPTDPTLQGHRGVDDAVQPRPEEAKAAATVCERLDAAARDFEGLDEVAVHARPEDQKAREPGDDLEERVSKDGGVAGDCVDGVRALCRSPRTPVRHGTQPGAVWGWVGAAYGSCTTSSADPPP